MNAPSPESSSDRFAASLGVSPADLPVVEEAFVAVMSSGGVDGRAIFQRLQEGKTLAAALSIPPGAVPLLYSRAHSWFLVGRFDKAEALFRGLCIIADDVADHWVGLGICLKMQNRFEEAEKVLAKGAERRPTWPVPYFHLAEIYMRRGNWRQARAALAAFDARREGDAPECMRAECERYHAALAARSVRAAASRSDQA
jgi:tetratricopeptide (TPR) repeat protein